MTFSIVAAGTIDQARDQVEATTVFGVNEQFDQVKAFILGQLDYPQGAGDPAFDYGVFIEANGYGGYGAPPYVSITIRPLYLRKAAEEETNEPADAEVAE